MLLCAPSHGGWALKPALINVVYLYSLKDLCQKIYQNLKSGNDHQIELIIKITAQNVKGAVSRNSAKLGNYKMPVKLRET